MTITIHQEQSPYRQPADDSLNIWFFWENLTPQGMPPYLRICQEIARKHCKNAVLHLVTPENLPDYLPSIDVDLDSIQMEDPHKPAVSLRSDYLRVKLLHEYGGLWLDADCVVLRDFSQEIFELIKHYDFVCVRKESKEDCYVTNNFMASRPKGTVIQSYLDDLEKLIATKKAVGARYTWTEIGAQLLTKAVDSANKETVKTLPENLVHPFDYTEAQDLQTICPKVDITERLSDETYCVMLYHSLFAGFIKKAPRSFILSSDSLVGQVLRLAKGKDALPKLAAPEDLQPRQAVRPEDIGIIFTTFARPSCCEDFLASIREHWGYGPNIYFAVQGEDELRGVYERMGQRYGAEPLFVANDRGLSASRNDLVRHTSEPVIFLCDDDFIVTERTRLDVALKIFNKRPDIKILGGVVDNQYYTEGNKPARSEHSSFDHRIFEIDHIPSQMMFIPSEYLFPEKEYIDHRNHFYFTDTVNNFALIDRAVFDKFDITWDDTIKIMGEHEDFYLSVKSCKRRDEIRVAFTNALEVEHHRKTSPKFGARRSRVDGIVRSLQKWGITSYVFFGKRIDAVTADGEHMRYEFPQWRRS